MLCSHDQLDRDMLDKTFCVLPFIDTQPPPHSVENKKSFSMLPDIELDD